MIKNKRVLAIIPARSGSKGVPRKNILDLCGKPVVEYSIDAALNSIFVDYIAVTTDDREMMEFLSTEPVEIINRPEEFATDTAPIELCLRHAVNEIEKKGTQIDIVVVLYANVPVRNNGIIDKVIKKLMETGSDSIQTYSQYTTPPQWAYKIEGDKPSLLDPQYHNAYRRQNLVSTYHPDGAVIAIRKEVLMDLGDTDNRRSFMGKDRRAVIQKPEETVDIDEPIDLLWAEFLLKKNK